MILIPPTADLPPAQVSSGAAFVAREESFGDRNAEAVGLDGLVLGLQAPRPLGELAAGAYVVRNTIRRNLFCIAIRPGVCSGFIPGEVNIVGRHACGQRRSLV